MTLEPSIAYACELWRQRAVAAEQDREELLALVRELEKQIAELKKRQCVDCGKDTLRSGEYYMVVDQVWAASGLGPDEGMLCLADLERRIGRALTGDDFTWLRPSHQGWAHLAPHLPSFEERCRDPLRYR